MNFSVGALVGLGLLAVAILDHNSGNKGAPPAQPVPTGPSVNPNPLPTTPSNPAPANPWNAHDPDIGDPNVVIPQTPGGFTPDDLANLGNNDPGSQWTSGTDPSWTTDPNQGVQGFGAPYNPFA